MLLVVSMHPVSVYAADTTDAHCKIQPMSVINKDTFSTDSKTHLQSDKVELNENNISRFKGNVVIQQKDKRIEAEQAEYIKQSEQVDAQGNVRLVTPNIQIKSESARFNLKSDQAVLEKSEFQSLNSRARGAASKIEVVNPHTTELSDATYTTCDPGNTDWYLSASSITLDSESHQGHATNVVLRFKDVPFFYFPYLRFPIGEERLSGFLFPSFGHSDEHGNELKLPYYWDIHPQLDATITPHYMSKRGTLLQTEFRYLTEKNNGTLNTEYLDNDSVINEKRSRLQWTHQSAPGLGWQAKAEYNYVADNQHLIDFSNDLNSTSATYLVRSGDVIYNTQNWLLNIKAEDHQILSGADSYKRLPQITLSSRYPVKQNQVNFALQTEAVRFDHVDNSKDIGQRIHIKPIISLPYTSAAGFFEPKITLQYTEYNLKQTAGEASLSTTIPTVSLNSGLFFERESQFFNTDYIQTLEPQVFYVYVPYKDQSAFPVFDTSVYAFNVNQFFSDYRFNGHDRIGDDNRLTTALTTRFINQKNGQENFMARIGQIHYFADRKVQLTPTVDTRSRSNMIAEVKTQFSAYGNWNLSSQLEWDPELKENVSSSNQVGYNYKKFNFDLAHRYQRNALETREMKMNWELNSRWNMNASHLYDIRNDHVVENLFGVKYESCCWGVQLSTKERYLSTAKTDRGIYLELILKGLGGFGINQ